MHRVFVAFLFAVLLANPLAMNHAFGHSNTDTSSHHGASSGPDHELIYDQDCEESKVDTCCAEVVMECAPAFMLNERCDALVPSQSLTHLTRHIGESHFGILPEAEAPPPRA